MTDDSWLISDDWWLMTNDYRLLTDDVSLMTDDRLVMTDEWWVITDDWWMISNDWWMLTDYWWLMTGELHFFPSEKYFIIHLSIFNLKQPKVETELYICWRFLKFSYLAIPTSFVFENWPCWFQNQATVIPLLLFSWKILHFSSITF
jgi:hypothetical protein